MVKKEFPSWIYELVEGWRKSVEVNIPYNLYDCGSCCIKHKIDKNRKNRFKYHIRFTDTGKKHGYTYNAKCNCGMEAAMLVKFKICSECDKILLGSVFRSFGEGPCPDCQKAEKTEKSKPRKLYFQQNIKVEFPDIKNVQNEVNCIHRTKCLEFNFKKEKQNDKQFLYCNDCPDIELFC